MPTFGSLFAGIGGIDPGLERAGWTCRWQVEWDPFCQRVLAKHWPDVPRYGDITAVDWSGVEPVDLIAGGFPCQPVSLAGKGLAQADERWLWPEFARAVRDLRPRLVLVENVPGLLARGMGDVLGDLAALGYDAEWRIVSAADVGAPHLRERVWTVGYRRQFGPRTAVSDAERELLRDERQWHEAPERADGTPPLAGDDGAQEPLAHAQVEPLRPGLRTGQPGGIGRGRSGDGGSEMADADGPGREERRWSLAMGTELGPAERGGEAGGPGHWWATEPDVGRVAHGVPARVDRLRALGNAVVPQVAEVIGRQLLAAIERAA